ncbi:hypothetical protein [Vulcanococcus sp.]|uniref:hypothetical protein n=1 Tax=Vulcanococcus sp. TaxID=2856995 RepID=UPI003F697161
MAVASPYAVFRAADVIWPPPLPPLPPVASAVRPAKRPISALVHQGELFPLSPVSV